MVRKVSIMLAIAVTIFTVSPELGNAQGRGGWHGGSGWHGGGPGWGRGPGWVWR